MKTSNGVHRKFLGMNEMNNIGLNAEEKLNKVRNRFNAIYFFRCLEVFFVLVLYLIICYGLYLSVEGDGLGSAGAAAWMQAIGTLIAVAGAFGISQAQSKAALRSILDAQKLSDDSKRIGVLAVVRAARAHATNIGDAVFDHPPLKIYEVYDKTVIAGVVGALSEAPLYEIGSPVAVVEILSLRDQFIFLGNQVEDYINGPMRHNSMAGTLESLPLPEYKDKRNKVYEQGVQILINNVKNRVKTIVGKCEIIEQELTRLSHK